MQLVEPETMERTEHDAATTLDGEASQREAASGVMGALENLPERQQEILRLKFQSGLSYQEIARVMDLSVGNVGFIIHTALKTLRVRMLAAEGGVSEPSPSEGGRGQGEGALGQRALGT